MRKFNTEPEVILFKCLNMSLFIQVPQSLENAPLGLWPVSSPVNKQILKWKGTPFLHARPPSRGGHPILKGAQFVFKLRSLFSKVFLPRKKVFLVSHFWEMQGGVTKLSQTRKGENVRKLNPHPKESRITEKNIYNIILSPILFWASNVYSINGYFTGNPWPTLLNFNSFFTCH